MQRSLVPEKLTIFSYFHSPGRRWSWPLRSTAYGEPSSTLNSSIWLCWSSEQRLREDYFHPALRACGIRLRKAYNTRHTFATINLMAGVNTAYIATQLGHADTTMLFKHYAKWIRGADSGAEAARSRAAFGAGKPLELVQTWSTDNVKPITSRG